jgi:cytochrome c oxidase assembly factor CtaG
MEAELFQSAQDDWSLPIGLTLVIALTALIYVRGWLALRKTRPAQFNLDRLIAFLGGLACLWIAIGSPLEALADDLLSAHMVEHLILMSLVPPLVLLGLPVVPLLRGLPRVVRVYFAGPLLRFRPLRGLVHFLVRKRVAWLAMNVTFVLWHIPAAYDFALEHEIWHDVEHLCFLGTSLLFWWCIIRPWPAGQRKHGWGILIYLVGADFVNTGLSAFLAFCGRAVYPYYSDHPNPLGIDPQADQVLGGVVMWVFGSTAFLIPAAVIAFALLQPSRKRRVIPAASARA